MKNKATIILIVIAVGVLIWFFVKKKSKQESSFRKRKLSNDGNQRTIYKCSRTVVGCDWSCAGNSITCPPSCATTSTQTFESSGPCPYGSTNLGIVRFE